MCIVSLVMKKLNLGCGGRPLEGYINIDFDSPSALSERYPEQDSSIFDDVISLDIFNLPYKDDTIGEIRADGLLEHLTFKQEPVFFRECFRVLQPGAKFHFSVPDFEWVYKQWLDANDHWKDFYSDSALAIASKHWFGNHSYSTDNRWGYLTAVIYGSQHGAGQFHYNCYSESKIVSILNHIGFSHSFVSRFLWKGDREMMLQATGII